MLDPGTVEPLLTGCAPLPAFCLLAQRRIELHLRKGFRQQQSAAAARAAWLGTNDYSSFCLINVFITASSSFIASSLIWMPSSTDGSALVCQLLDGHTGKEETGSGSFITVARRKWEVAHASEFTQSPPLARQLEIDAYLEWWFAVRAWRNFNFWKP